MDFYSYTKEDLSRTWSLYDDDGSMETRAAADKTNTSTFSGKSSPTRDTWDPMLYNINLTTYLELNMDEDVQVRKQPMLETPITPLPGMEDLQVFLSVSHSLSEHARVRQNSVKDHHYVENISDRELSGNLQKVK